MKVCRNSMGETIRMTTNTTTLPPQHRKPPAISARMIPTTIFPVLRPSAMRTSGPRISSGPGVSMMLALAWTALAQEPDDRWITLRTEHYRIVAPADAREWAVHMAERLESMRARVVAEVGYDPPGRIDVMVRDPWSDSNGYALPFL